MTRPEPENKVLPFKLPEPLPRRWCCPCGSTEFTLWTDARVYCAMCRSHHYKISFNVDEAIEEPAA
jgi:hypothetical protein